MGSQNNSLQTGNEDNAHVCRLLPIGLGKRNSKSDKCEGFIPISPYFHIAIDNLAPVINFQ